MQVLVKKSKVASDVRCSVCGAGFLVNWTRSSREEQAQRRAEIIKELRSQHMNETHSAVHPVQEFNLPKWEGDPAASAAAMIRAKGWAA